MRRGDRQQGVADGAAFPQRRGRRYVPFRLPAARFDALGNRAVDLVRVEPQDLCRGDRRAKDAEDGPGVKAARHYRRDEVGGHALHDLVAGDEAGE